MSKLIAKYYDTNIDFYEVRGKQYAELVGYIEHPVLGNRYFIDTSEIVSPMDSAGTFETLNTVYMKGNE